MHDYGVFFLFRIGDVIIIVIHVDDCTLVTSSKGLMIKLKSDLGSRYDIVDLGEARWLLGFEIQRDRHTRTLTLSQAGYIATLLERFRMTDAYALSVPLDPHVNLFDVELTAKDHSEMATRPYARLIGSLMYAAIGTRPDVAFTVSLLARFMSDPAPVHWDAAKRVLRYLKGTRDLRLTFSGSDEGLIGFTDADWCSLPHRHSISGYVFTFSGGAVSWRSRKQPIISLSSTEAEYVAASEAGRELLWLRYLIGELTHPLQKATPLRCDNQSAIAIVDSGLLHARTKHIDIRFRFIQYVQDSGAASITYIPTGDMIADILTKALPRSKIGKLVALLGLRLA